LKYLLILAAVALALAPLAHFMPSKRQRQQARMREYAAVHGLFVEFRDLPGRPDPHGSGRRQQVIYYGRRLPASRGDPRPRQAWLRGAAGWESIAHRRPAPGAAAAMPEAVLALGLDEGSCGAYWREDGGESDVQAIVEAICAWETELRGA